MALFATKKKNKKKKQQKTHTFEDSPDDAKVELFRVGALSMGQSVDDTRKLERRLFGRAFEDLLKDGYVPSIAVKDDDGCTWTALGKVPAGRVR